MLLKESAANANWQWAQKRPLQFARLRAVHLRKLSARLAPLSSGGRSVRRLRKPPNRPKRPQQRQRGRVLSQLAIRSGVLPFAICYLFSVSLHSLASIVCVRCRNGPHLRTYTHTNTQRIVSIEAGKNKAKNPKNRAHTNEKQNTTLSPKLILSLSLFAVRLFARFAAPVPLANATLVKSFAPEVSLFAAPKLV